jgi:hypothetical protein
MSNPYKETYVVAPIATNRQLTTAQSDQLQFCFNLHIIRRRPKEAKRSVDTLPDLVEVDGQQRYA